MDVGGVELQQLDLRVGDIKVALDLDPGQAAIAQWDRAVRLGQLSLDLFDAVLVDGAFFVEELVGAERPKQFAHALVQIFL
ncbi:hypothetical protein D3C71_1726080 [compost metagenome]